MAVWSVIVATTAKGSRSPGTDSRSRETDTSRREGAACVDPRHELGRRAEALAAEFLVRNGYEVLARNVRVGRLEVDIVARQGATVAVVEVRTRSARAWVKALDTVDWRKRQRLRAAGRELWRQRFQRDLSVETMRFDVISVSFTETGAPTIEHARAAF
ncbi:MAG: YraN family protein [Polyangiaceae bacterium]